MNRVISSPVPLGRLSDLAYIQPQSIPVWVVMHVRPAWLCNLAHMELGNLGDWRPS